MKHTAVGNTEHNHANSADAMVDEQNQIITNGQVFGSGTGYYSVENLEACEDERENRYT